MKAICIWTVLLLGFAGVIPAATSDNGKFESLGIPVRKGGLMGCILGPNGRGGEALYFNFNQISGKLFLVQVDPDTGAARQFNAPQGPGAWGLIAGPDGQDWDVPPVPLDDPSQHPLREYRFAWTDDDRPMMKGTRVEGKITRSRKGMSGMLRIISARPFLASWASSRNPGE